MNAVYKPIRVGGCLQVKFLFTSGSTKDPNGVTVGITLYNGGTLHVDEGKVANRLWLDGTGSTHRVARLHLMHEPPSIDKGEITDKGSINQRAVLLHRAALVEALHRGEGIAVVLPHRQRQ